MKVTDEMVRKAGDVLFRHGWYVAGHDMAPLRAALKAALEDDSEPPAWVEHLSARWEKEARDLRELAARKRWDDEGQMRLLTEAETYEDCAEQLRERAKPG